MYNTSTDEYKAIINNLRTVIDESGMKQKVVAERAGMPPKQLNNILCFRRRLDAGSIPRLCIVLGIPVNRLFEMKV